MDDSRTNNTPDETQDADVTERQKDFTRRALLRAGWVAPLVTAVNIPSAFAQSGPPPHTDHTDHSDVPHQDHTDAHTDVHTDVHTDTHTDTPTPHTDVPHVDSAALPHQDHQDHSDSHGDAGVRSTFRTQTHS
jgi:hypothetical protein